MSRRWKNPDSYPVCTEVQVRFRDLDPFGHLNNGVYFSYFEEARIEYFARLPFVREHVENGSVLEALIHHFPSVVVKASVEFRAEARLHERLKSCVRIDSIKKSFIEFHYGIFHKETERYIGGGSTTLLAVDPQTMKPVSVTPDIVKQVNELEGKEIPYVQ